MSSVSPAGRGEDRESGRAKSETAADTQTLCAAQKPNQSFIDPSFINRGSGRRWLSVMILIYELNSLLCQLWRISTAGPRTA